jgi:hypothetical protein
MHVMMRTAIAAVALAVVPVAALARGGFNGGHGAGAGAGAGAGHGGGVPACEQALTNVPWGTTDTSCVGGPPGPGGWYGGTGGPGMRITPQARKNWPDFPAPVSGRQGWIAGGDAPITSQPVR